MFVSANYCDLSQKKQKNAYNIRFFPLIQNFFQKTLAFCFLLCYNIKRSMKIHHKRYMRNSAFEEVSIWQSAVFAERVSFSDRLFPTHIVKQTEHGSPIFAR